MMLTHKPLLGAALLMGGLGLCIATTFAHAQSDWVDIKDPKELHALYSNKTFKGKDWKDRPFVGHYRADGQGVMLLDGARIPRTWQVKGNDQVCVKLPWDSPCYRFQRHKAKAGTYRSINVANDEVTEFTVEDGTPKF